MSNASQTKSVRNSLAGQAWRFEEEAIPVLTSLRSAVAAVVESIAPPVRRASEFQQALGLDKNLSWSVFTIATAQDVRQVASLAPGGRAMSRVFDAAQKRGVPISTLDRAKRAFEDFEATVQRHADDRDAFELMVSELGPIDEDASAALDSKARRAAFRTNALLWGRQVRAIVGAVAVHPSGTEGSQVMDRALISGTIGLRQTRRGAPLQTTLHFRRVPNAGDPVGTSPMEALDPRESAPDAVGLLRDFCSQPLPEFRAISQSPGHYRHDLVGRGLGASAEVTAFTGRVIRRACVPPGSVAGSELTVSKLIDTPTELYIRDVLLHESVWDEQLPEIGVYAQPADGSIEFLEADRLPFVERATYLGRGVEAARTPEAPQYREALEYAMNRLGWDADAFRVFRCRVEHPIMYSRVRMTFRRKTAIRDGM